MYLIANAWFQYQLICMQNCSIHVLWGVQTQIALTIRKLGHFLPQLLNESACDKLADIYMQCTCGHINNLLRQQCKFHFNCLIKHIDNVVLWNIANLFVGLKISANQSSCASLQCIVVDWSSLNYF